LLTILVAPLMSCSARLPVYVLLINAFIPDRHWVSWLPGLQALVMFSMYLIGLLAAVGVAWLLRRTLFRGPTPPFVMELPTYKRPSVLLALHRMLDSGWSFVRRAGTLILAISVLVWALAYYPRDAESLPPELVARHEQLMLRLGELQPLEGPQPQEAGSVPDAPDAPPVDAMQAEQLEQREQLEELVAATENELQGEYLRDSYLGRMGQMIEPLVRPLGWDWRIGCAVIASFPAREVVVATLGVIYNLGQEQDEESPTLRDTLRSATWDGTDRRVFSIPVALSVMVFFSLCAQCVSTLIVMRRETNSWRWPVFTFAYMTALAYCGAWLAYHGFSWLLR
jgi:ferrous iron transport protein B